MVINSIDFWVSPTSCLSFRLTTPSVTPRAEDKPGLAKKISNDSVFYSAQEGKPLRSEIRNGPGDNNPKRKLIELPAQILLQISF